jgi:hypothetical protein
LHQLSAGIDIQEPQVDICRIFLPVVLIDRFAQRTNDVAARTSEPDDQMIVVNDACHGRLPENLDSYFDVRICSPSDEAKRYRLHDHEERTDGSAR